MQKIKCKWLILINYSTATASKTKFIQSKTTFILGQWFPSVTDNFATQPISLKGAGIQNG